MAACGDSGKGNTSDGPFFPTQTANAGSYPTALVTGELKVVDGCLALGIGGSDQLLPLWPEGFYLEDGEVHARGNDVVAKVGDVVDLGGGEVSPESVSGFVGSDIPPRCAGLDP